MPRTVNPRRSNRDRISPLSRRAWASGLIITNVRSRSGMAGLLGRRRAESLEPGVRSGFGGGRLAADHVALARGAAAGNGRLAVGAETPLGIERALAAAAGVLQLGAAVRAGQEAGLGRVAAVRADLVCA